MSGFTNKLKTEIMDAFFRGEPILAIFYLALVTDDQQPEPDIDTFGDRGRKRLYTGRHRHSEK